MSDFYKAINYVLENEGGLSDHPADPGGTTKYGISLRFLKSEGIDLNKDSTIDVKDIYYLDLLTAKEIYKKYFWDPNKYGSIEDQGLATKVFDLAVNMGSKNANRILQRSINTTGKFDIQTDGVIGSKTINAANGCAATFIQDVMRVEAGLYYNQLIVNKPSLSVFRNGWMNRANKMYEV